MGRLLRFNFTVGFIVLYTIASATVSLIRFWQGQVYYFDFGIFDRAIWEVSRFQQPLVDHFELSSDKVSIFATHFYPSIFLLSPFFYLTDNSEVLLILQSLAVGLGAFFSYLIAKDTIKSKIAIFALIFAFLGYVGLQNALITEFHETTLAVFPISVIFWAILKGRWKIYFISLIILLGLKESFAGLGVTLGIYIILFNRKNWSKAVITILVSLIWGILAVKVIIPFLSKGKYLYDRASIPESPLEFLKALVLPDPKFKTIFFSLLTFGFLPLVGYFVLPLVFEHFLERFVFDFPTRWSLAFHYNATLSPLLFIGGLQAISFFEKRGLKTFVRAYSLVIIIIVFVLHRFILNGPLGLFYNKDFYNVPLKNELLVEYKKSINFQSVVMTQNNLAVDFTRKDVRLLRKDYDQVNPDYIILNLSVGQTDNSFYPLQRKDVLEVYEKLLKDKKYKLIDKKDEVFVFSKS